MSEVPGDEYARASAVVRDVNGALVGAQSREEIETAVCATLAESDPYVFAWIGTEDGAEVTPRATAGVEDSYLEDVDISVDSDGPTATALRTGSIQAMQDIREDPTYEPWREQALEHGFESSAAVPIEDGDSRYGVLNVYANRPAAFDERERQLLAGLGETIATAISNVETRERLATQRRKYKQLTERISDAYYAVDADWQITYWNDQMASRVDVPSKDVEGEVLWEVFPELLDTESERQYRKAMRTQEQRSFETYLEEPYDYWVEIDVYPDKNGLSIFSRDITDRKERERKLEETKEILESIIQAAPDPIIMLDDELQVRLWNPGAERLLGWSHSEVIGQRAPFVPEDREAEFLELIEQLDEGVDNRSVETTRQRKDGSRIDVSISSAKVDAGDVFTGYLAIFKDIRQRKEYERRLESQRDSLEVLNQMVRHDIRNNLQVILSYAGLLGEYVDEDGADYVEQVLNNAESAVELTQTARDLAEAMMQSTSDRGPVSLRSALSNQLDEVRSSFANAVITTAGPIPTVDVLADDMLPSVFRNVLHNAATHNNKEVPRVSVAVETHPDTVEIHIADNGRGIPDDQKEAVFDRNEKGLESEGTGIGLYLVNTLLEHYDGNATITDRADADSAAATDIDGDEGTVVTIELQRA